MKKRFWRCIVCNDIHWGVKPPEVCPTCRIKDVYVEISAAEAKAILGGAAGAAEFDREAFRAAITAFAEHAEFQVHADREKVEMLLDGVFNNLATHGLKYCPCRLRSKDFDEDLKICCPCNFLSHETYRGVAGGECWCGLFKKR